MEAHSAISNAEPRSQPVRRAVGAEPFPGYRLLAPLGSGGFGEVWKCEVPGGLCKAIKFVNGNLNGLDEDSKAVRQELAALHRIKAIRHPFILSTERVEIIDGQLLIVMELADKNLDDVLLECRDEGKPGIARDLLLSLFLEAAEALDLINFQHGLQHLDIKPKNLFLIGNHIKVADFGLVFSFADSVSQRKGGITPVYTAPELFESRISRQADQYSLALTYQELLTATFPYKWTNINTLVMQHLKGEPDLSSLPSRDRPVVARALAKDPSKRFPSCMAFIDELVRSQDSGTILLPTPAEHRAAHDSPVPRSGSPLLPEERPTAEMRRPNLRGEGRRELDDTGALGGRGARGAGRGPRDERQRNGEQGTRGSRAGREVCSSYRPGAAPACVSQSPAPLPRVVSRSVLRAGEPLALAAVAAEPLPLEFLAEALAADLPRKICRWENFHYVQRPDDVLEYRCPVRGLPSDLLIKLKAFSRRWQGKTVDVIDGAFVFRITEPVSFWKRFASQQSGLEVRVELLATQRPGASLTEALVCIGTFGDADMSEKLLTMGPLILESFHWHLQPPQEQRRQERYAHAHSVVIYPILADQRLGQQIEAAGKDISTSGVGFFVREPVPTDMIYVNLVELPQAAPFGMLARIVRAQATEEGTYEVGARFMIDPVAQASV
jgi:hypothetical protein